MPDSAGELQKRHRSKFRPHSLSRFRLLPLGSVGDYLVKSRGTLRRITGGLYVQNDSCSFNRSLALRLISNCLCRRKRRDHWRGWGRRRRCCCWRSGRRGRGWGWGRRNWEFNDQSQALSSRLRLSPLSPPLRSILTNRRRPVRGRRRGPGFARVDVDCIERLESPAAREFLILATLKTGAVGAKPSQPAAPNARRSLQRMASA